MSVKGQSFNGGTDGGLINFGVGGAASVLAGAYTIVCLARTSNSNVGFGAGFTDSVGGTAQGGLLLSDNSGGRIFNANADFTGGWPETGADANGINDNVWRWHAISKASGSQVYRKHYADLATLTWSHGTESGAATHANFGGTAVAFSTWSVYALGFDTTDMAVLAFFNYALSDSQIEAACTKILRDLWTAGGGAPQIGWSFPEAQYANGSIFGDFTQGGGNETLRQLTAASSDPPNFNMGIIVDKDPAWVTAGGGSGVSLTTASFNAAVGSLIILEAQVDGTAGGPPGGWTMSDSVGLTWTEIGTVQQATNGGYVRAWSAYTDVARTGMTVSSDFQSNNAKSIKITTYLGTDPATPPISKLQSNYNTNNPSTSVTNTYIGGWVAGTGLDYDASGLPSSGDQQQGYHISLLISGMSVRETTPRITAGGSVPLDFNAFGTSTGDWAIKIWEIVPAPIVTDATGNAYPMAERLPPHILMRLIQAINDRGMQTVTPQIAAQSGAVTVGIAGGATAVKKASPGGRYIRADASDNFNRADVNPIGGNWTTVPAQGAMLIVSGQMLPTNLVIDHVVYWNAGSWPNDQYSEARLYVTGDVLNEGPGLTVRSDTGTNTYYRMVASHTTSGANVELGRMVSDSYTTLWTRNIGTWNDGDSFRLEVQGSELRAYVNGVQIGSPYVDGSPIASGRPGAIYSSSGVTTVSLDDWVGGSVLFGQFASLGLQGSGAETTSGAVSETGRAAVGFSGTATVVKVATPTARCVVGLSGSVVSAKKMAQASTVAVGLAGVAAAKKVMAETSTVAMGLSGRGTTVKVAKGVASSIVGFTAAGAENKKSPATGVGTVGFAPYGPTQGQRAQTGRCVMGLHGRSVVVKTSTPVASTVVGLVGVSTARKMTGQASVTTIGFTGRSTNVKRATSASSVSLGVSCVSTARKITTRTGVASLGIAPSAAPRKKMAILGRACLGIAPHGEVYHAPPPPDVTLLRELSLTTGYRTRLSTGYGTTLDAEGNEVSLRWLGS